MSKPKAEAWLTSAFYEGVMAYALETRRAPLPAYRGALGRCYLAQFDERRRPCSGPFERFHFLNRQRVENALGAVMPVDGTFFAQDDAEAGEDVPLHHFLDHDDLILLAAWDPRNGEVGCEGHHRRYDSHLTPPLTVPAFELPARLLGFIFDYGLETQAENRWPGFGDAHAGYRIDPVSTLPNE